MATKNNKPKGIVYSEPDDYLPKDIYDKYFGNKGKSKKQGTKKTTTDKKKK